MTSITLMNRSHRHESVLTVFRLSSFWCLLKDWKCAVSSVNSHRRLCLFQILFTGYKCAAFNSHDAVGTETACKNKGFSCFKSRNRNWFLIEESQSYEGFFMVTFFCFQDLLHHDVSTRVSKPNQKISGLQIHTSFFLTSLYDVYSIQVCCFTTWWWWYTSMLPSKRYVL